MTSLFSSAKSPQRGCSMRTIDPARLQFRMPPARDRIRTRPAEFCFGLASTMRGKIRNRIQFRIECSSGALATATVSAAQQRAAREAQPLRAQRDLGLASPRSLCKTCSRQEDLTGKLAGGNGGTTMDLGTGIALLVAFLAIVVLIIRGQSPIIMLLLLAVLWSAIAGIGIDEIQKKI